MKTIKAFSQWEIRTYDVWGNARDGYEVNDIYYYPYDVEIQCDPTDKQIIQALKEAGVIGKYDRYATYEIHWGDENHAYVNRVRDGFPVCELFPVHRMNNEGNDE